MVEIKKLKKGNYVVHDGEPHIIKDLQFVVYGTHSHTKAKIILQNLFTGKIIETSLPLHEQMQEANIIRKCASIISKEDSKMQIMDAVSFETIDADIESELLKQADENDQVTYIQFGNIAKVIEIRKR